MIKLPRWLTVPALACLVLLALRLAAAQQAMPQAPSKVMPAAPAASLSNHLLRPTPGGILCASINLGAFNPGQSPTVKFKFVKKGATAEEAGWKLDRVTPYNDGTNNYVVVKVRAPLSSASPAPTQRSGLSYGIGAGTGTLTVTVDPGSNSTDIPVDDPNIDPCG
jgi:hypothetical protein